MIIITVNGLESLPQLMTRLGRAYTPKEQERAIKAGLKVTEREMKSNVKKKSGNLARSIHVEKDRMLSKAGAITIRVGRRKKKKDWMGQGFHAHLIEYGTQAHDIKSKTGQKMPVFAKGGGLVGFTNVIHHPGSQAFHPFSKAIDRTQAQAIHNTEQELIRIIEREWNRK